MPADASAYTALGLAPGADWEAVQLAYKKLIERYHPGRDRGDAARAAEINRAYREIRRAREERDRRVFGQVDFLATPPRRRRWVWVAAVVVAAAVGAAPFAAEPLARFARDFSLEKVAPLAVDDVEGDHAPDGNMARPLAIGAIDGAVGDALRMARGRDEVALASTSRECHRQLRLTPSLERLDRCAAFDDAVVLLQNRDPLRSRAVQRARDHRPPAERCGDPVERFAGDRR
ncbi:MAG TPA: J domain-containing protein, partial [Novosphingobium sp.]|nr:J domain-containing protein [Novosphingobium sp.]